MKKKTKNDDKKNKRVEILENHLQKQKLVLYIVGSTPAMPSNKIAFLYIINTSCSLKLTGDH